MSFVLFLGLLLAAATRSLKANKDGFTLGFAVSHMVHLAFILVLMAATGREHSLKGIMIVAFSIGILFRYGLANFATTYS